jgi:FlaA1/EpsC-like NDP-sugar epimerase
VLRARLSRWFITLKRGKKAFILINADVIFTFLALWAAFSVRWGEFYLPKSNEWSLFLVAPMIAVPIFIRMGLYRAIIRYIEIRALWTIVQATALYAVVFAFVLYAAGFSWEVPRTVPLLNGIFMLVFVASSRFIARWWLSDIYLGLSGYERNQLLGSTKNVLIYGAGSAGIQLASALEHGRKLKLVAFIDDDSSLFKQKINGIKIYPLSSLGSLVKKYAITDVLLALPSASKSRRTEIIHLLEPYAVHVMSMPRLSDIAEGKISFDVLQEVDIADILGRNSVAPDPGLLSGNIYNKTVMVTGAGGSIGSELCRQIIQLMPSRLILFELNEYALYSIEKELIQLSGKQGGDRCEVLPFLGSITHAERVEKICDIFKVQTIYHAAAYKHVPMVEMNPLEAVYTNIFGTLGLARLAVKTGVETFVLISTDKAVRPTNVMGATKRFSELILQAFSQDNVSIDSTRFTMVRFGNVLGSSGSVVPLFREQIAHGGPVTVTDERVIRYFMTIPEASQLVIQAGAMGLGGDVFVLDMGEPIRILDMAKRMIHLSGLEVKDENHPEGDIEIKFTGLRPGEKLYEELLIGGTVSVTSHPGIMRAEEQIIPWIELEAIIHSLEQSVKSYDVEKVREILQKTVVGFVPETEIGDLLWKELQQSNS